MAFDALRYLVSNVTISASTNGSALDLLNTPGGPIQGYEFSAYMSNGVGTANTANITNTSATAQTIVFQIQEGSETSFTNTTATNILISHTETIATSATLNLQAIALPILPSQRYIRAIVNPSSGVTITGLNIQMDSGRKIRS